ncbi:hypothetical protein [Herbidospora mongoliensis]|uniref:hypothetical protein n=1 Tax=Herbidospora mongoliensis TaxID=688067 RepID=UPI00082DBABD|nr:hypothetical protein [Herbidospora mongoliensis]
MNDVISRLKDATTAAGETISDVPELRLERAQRGFLVPVAAALAVGLAIAGSVVMTRGALDQTVATNMAPRFFVEARDQVAVNIRSVTDGAAVDRLDATGGWLYNQVQAAPDNQTFYATMSGAGSCSGKIVQFALDNDGRAGPLTELPVRPPSGNRFSAFTVSGDGTKVVFGAVPCAAGGNGTIVVADAESGAAQTLSVGPSAGFTSISANEDGSKIAYMPLSMGDVTVHISEPAVELSPGSPSGDVVVIPPPTVVPSSAVSGNMATIAPPLTGPGGPIATTSSGAVNVAPADLVPSQAGDGTLASISSCRFYAPVADRQILPGQTWTLDCPDASEVYVIDAAQPGAAPRQVELAATLGGTKGEVYGVRMSADGTRLIAGVGTGTADLDNAQAAIMAFDASSGAPAGILYQGRPWLRLLDLAAGDTRMLVQSQLEIGVVSENAYRKVLDIPGRVMDGVVAW